MQNLAKWGSLLAIIGGVSWIVKTLLLYLGAPENVLIGTFYFGGLLGPIGGGFAVSCVLLRTRNVATQAAVGVVLAIVFFLLTFAVQDPLEGPFRGSFEEDIVTEIPILILGVLWAIVGTILWIKRPRPQAVEAGT